MKAFVDQEVCIGCEMCTSVCGEVFSMDSNGKAKAISGDIPSDVEDCAVDAKDSCPVAAISIEE